MKKREQYKKLVLFSLSVIIVGLQTGLFAATWMLGYKTDGPGAFVRGNCVLIMFYALLVLLFGRLFGAFKVGYLRVLEVLFSQVISVLCVNTVIYLQLCLTAHWRFASHLKPILWMTLFDLILTTIWVIAARWVFVSLYPPRKLLLIYGKYSPDNLVHKIQSRADKYDIQKVISYEEDFAYIQQEILNYGGVVLTDIPCEIRNQILKYTFEHNIRCYCVPKISDVMIKCASEIHLFDTSLLLMRNLGLTAEQKFIKRTFDVVMSSIALILASPFMAVIALCIKLYDRGPVFFTQDRMTQDGRVFKIYKFRSMYVSSNKGQYCLTRKKDNRITPVGKVIRAIHFDELPQLINIFKGDMSFVGPRPECPELANEYSTDFPEFKFRLKVKAGLTGFAQVYGKYNTTPYDKLKLDLTYIENYSFWLDIKLMFLTFKILFQRSNTEGIESWQTSADIHTVSADAPREKEDKA